MSKQFGFTIAEMLVVLTVIMTVTGFGTASYLNFNNRQILEQAGKTMVNNLRQAQSSAVSGEKDESICGSNYLSGWCFSPTAVNEYSIYGGCSDELPPESPVNTFKPTSVDLSNMELTAWEDFNTELDLDYAKIVFKALGDKRVGIFDGDGLETDSITYCLDSAVFLANHSYKITITSGGEIQDYGIVATTSCHQ